MIASSHVRRVFWCEFVTSRLVRPPRQGNDGLPLVVTIAAERQFAFVLCEYEAAVFETLLLPGVVLERLEVVAIILIGNGTPSTKRCRMLVTFSVRSARCAGVFCRESSFWV